MHECELHSASQFKDVKMQIPLNSKEREDSRRGVKTGSNLFRDVFMMSMSREI
jgi:hypothetical protein